MDKYKQGSTINTINSIIGNAYSSNIISTQIRMAQQLLRTGPQFPFPLQTHSEYFLSALINVFKQIKSCKWEFIAHCNMNSGSILIIKVLLVPWVLAIGHHFEKSASERSNVRRIMSWLKRVS